MSPSSSTVAASAPPAGVYAFGSTWQREWFAASCGCTIADTIFNPLEVLKVRKQIAMSASSAGTSATSIGLARSAIAEKGIARGLWLPGLEATAYRAFSYTGFRIGLYPTVRNAMVESGTFGDADSVACRIAAGATTGAVGSAIFNPIDVVRIRMQGASPYPSTLEPSAPSPGRKGSLDCGGEWTCAWLARRCSRAHSWRRTTPQNGG